MDKTTQPQTSPINTTKQANSHASQGRHQLPVNGLLPGNRGPVINVTEDMFYRLEDGEALLVYCPTLDKHLVLQQPPSTSHAALVDASVEAQARLAALSMLIVNQQGYLELNGHAVMGLSGMLDDIQATLVIPE